uniref:EH domain-containing protein n=1 Tax=Noctiluca scintillans TaxID=2966 RepID=A0A7S1F2I0_NOCSC|mmetsp:Transcript_29239/g.77260  ORF Transcript_29239/g.77260 Transcript_29239/m.77260 type:complete len:606 (+) Transcript_29239:121-1938(+)
MDAFTMDAYGGEAGFDGNMQWPSDTGHGENPQELGEVTDEDAQEFAHAYASARNAQGYVMPDEAQQCMAQSGLPTEILSQIWDLSDLDRDRRLSLREFVCAMYLAKQTAWGQPLPVAVQSEQQAHWAHKVERYVPGDGDFLEPKGFSPSDDFSTVDTANSGSRKRHKDKSRKKKDRRDELGNMDSSATSAFDFDSAPSQRIPDRGLDDPLEMTSTAWAPDVMRSPSRLDRFGGADDVREALPDMDAALGELALCFETLARDDSTGELSQLSGSVLEERRELKRLVERRRDCDRQHHEYQQRLNESLEQRRKVQTEVAAQQRHVAHLQEELRYLDSEVREAEDDLAVLRESSGIQGGSDRLGADPYMSRDEERHDVLSKVRSEQEMLLRDQREIHNIRTKIKALHEEKLACQTYHDDVLEKRRVAENDRGMMLTAIETERAKVGSLRSDRITMWEERCDLEHALRNLQQEQWYERQQGPPTRPHTTGNLRDDGEADSWGRTKGVPYNSNTNRPPATVNANLSDIYTKYFAPGGRYAEAERIRESRAKGVRDEGRRGDYPRREGHGFPEQDDYGRDGGHYSSPRHREDNGYSSRHHLSSGEPQFRLS